MDLDNILEAPIEQTSWMSGNAAGAGEVVSARKFRHEASLGNKYENLLGAKPA